jgi:lipopolysaccharide transport system ATP-binding protein
MPAITRLCERVILLNEGHVLKDGPSHEVVPAYLNSGLGTSAAREWKDPARAPTGEVARLRAVRVRSEDGQIAEAVDIRRPVGIEMEFDVIVPGRKLLPHFVLHNQEGVLVFVSVDQDPEWLGKPRPVGRYVSTGWIPGNLLAEGTLFVNANMFSMEPRQVQFVERDAAAFQVIDSIDGDSARGGYGGVMPGVVRPLLEWTTEFSPSKGLLRSGSTGGNGSEESQR